MRRFSSFFAQVFRKRSKKGGWYWPDDRVLCLDFDGVLHAATTPYRGIPAEIPDPPIRHAREFTQQALTWYDLVVILSCRARPWHGRRAIRAWLRLHRFPKGLEVTDRKPYAEAYVDDKAVRFVHIPSRPSSTWPWHLLGRLS